MEPTAESHSWRPVRILVHIEEAFGALTLVAIVVFVSLQVAGRYAITEPLVWTDEMARLSLVWMTFVGASYVMAHGEHITIELFEKLVPAKVAKVIDVFAMVAVVGTCLAFLPGAVEVAIDTRDIGSPALGFPRSLIYAAAITGFVLIAVHAVLRIIEILAGRTPPPSEEITVGAV